MPKMITQTEEQEIVEDDEYGEAKKTFKGEGEKKRTDRQKAKKIFFSRLTKH